MSRPRAFGIVAALALAVGGCVPQKLLVWSPDGKKAAVIGGDGLYLCDEAGRLSARLVAGGAAAAWLPDSARLVVEVVRERTGWRDVEPFLDGATRQRVASTADRFLREATATRGSLARVADRVRAAGADDGSGFDDEMATLLYLREHHAPRLRERFGQEWTALEEVPLATSTIQMFDVSAGRAKPGPVLAASFTRIDDLRLSPDGSVLAYVTDDIGSAGTCRIFVVPLDGSHPATLVADLTARYPDWSADGRFLVYARANAPREGPQDTLRLGSLRRLRLADDSGRLLAELPADREKSAARPADAPRAEPAAEVLAGFVFSVWTKVRCLGDGRIVFSGAEVTLPATAEDMPTHLALFAVEPGRRATVARLVPRRAEGEIAEIVHHFELSPDQTRVAIPGIGGRLTVLSLSTGAVVEVRPRRGDTALRMVPTWRNDRELSFAVANEGALQERRPGEFCVWSAGAARTLSSDWPDPATAALKLGEEKKPPPSIGRR